MTLTGSFLSFMQWVSDDPKREADTALYQLTVPNNPTKTSRVTMVLYGREAIEWIFPSTEIVTLDQLQKVTRFSIQVDDWVL